MEISIHKPFTIRETGKRDRQEDTVHPAPGETSADDRLFVLCDGMGGHESGDVASRTVCDAIVGYLQSHWQKGKPLPDQVLADAVEQACLSIDKHDGGKGKGMGSTLALLAFHAGGCTALHIGDSRIYHLRTSECRWAYISRDHSVVFDLYQSGEISYDEMRTSPRKNIITKAIRAGNESHPKPDIVHIGDVRPDDYFFLCSDGMLESMDDDSLLRLLCAKQPDKEKARRLVELTKDNDDNHSAHLVHVSEVSVAGNESIDDDEKTTRCNALNVVPRPRHDVQKAEEGTGQAPQPRRNAQWLIWLALALAAVAVACFLLLQGHGEEDAKEPPAKTIQIKPITH